MNISSFLVVCLAAIVGVAISFRKYSGKMITKRLFIVNTIMAAVFVCVAAYFLLIR